MQRRDFLKTSGALVAAAAITPPSVLAQAPSGSRLVLPINRGWRYKPSKVEGAVAPSFDDSGFERVTLPHTNIRLHLSPALSLAPERTRRQTQARLCRF
jgi:beta-galactosidase